MLRTMILTLVTIALLGTSAQAQVEPSAQRPSWDDVQKLCKAYFASKGLPMTDLVTQSEVTPLFAYLTQLGWQVDDQDAIIKAVPQDGEFLVQQLRTPAGQKFVKDMRKDKMSYDRVDRLSRIPRGQQMVHDLIKGPGGYRMIEYMTEAKGGTVLGQQLSLVPRGKNFNKATSRLYTPNHVIEALKKSYSKPR